MDVPLSPAEQAMDLLAATRSVPVLVGTLQAAVTLLVDFESLARDEATRAATAAAVAALLDAVKGAYPQHPPARRRGGAATRAAVPAPSTGPVPRAVVPTCLGPE
ncbi:hypothetical protein [Streptomyces sp. NPDC020817]|uniref:hypothetical protein n=1 Tax=Streptomyces sp. NPDC020817 TaxID=3365095 RepID=UPI0037BC0330